MASNNWWQRNAPQWLGGDPVGAEQVYNAEQAALTRDFNAEEAAKNRDFQERMSNTSYQRAFADLRAAGLNPYLAYGQGGASSPNGSVASASSAFSGHSNSDFLTSFASFVTDVASAVKGSTRVTNYNFGR